jgi:hypothetical protein
MSGPQHANLPTQAQINAQFTKEKIHRSLAFYDKIKKPNGGYELGDLSVQWYGPNAPWMTQVGTYYNATAQQKIAGFIKDFLTNTTNGKPDPIPFTIHWTEVGIESITKTSNSIEIVGYRAPP